MHCFLVLLLTAALAQAVQADYRAEKEAALNRFLLADLERREQLVKSSILEQFLLDLVARLSLPGEALPRVLVIDDTDNPVASAMPGGVILLSRATLIRIGAEDELAAVIAHELAHARLRHGWPASSHPGVPVIVVIGPYGICQRTEANRRAMPSGSRSVAAMWEVEADETALGILQAAGYAPAALPTAFGRWGPGATVAQSVRSRAASMASSPGARSADRERFEQVRSEVAMPTRRIPSLLRVSNSPQKGGVKTPN